MARNFLILLSLCSVSFVSLATLTVSYTNGKPSHDPLPLSGPNMGCVHNRSKCPGRSWRKRYLGKTWEEGGEGESNVHAYVCSLRLGLINPIQSSSGTSCFSLFFLKKKYLYAEDVHEERTPSQPLIRQSHQSLLCGEDGSTEHHNLWVLFAEIIGISGYAKAKSSELNRIEPSRTK